MPSLYLVRHAIAADRGPEYPDDTARPLTSKGRRRMREIAAGLRRLDPAIDRILTSPLVRAASTADLLREGLGGRATIAVCDALAPGGTPEATARALSPVRGARAVALVGHEPDLGEFAAWLLGTREPLPFKKGGIARIDVPRLPPGQTGRLVWFATPRILRR